MAASAAMKFGILGGTFNPIHWGHLLLAETARDQLGLDRVLFIPVHQPPHKNAKGLLPGAVRLELVQVAIRDHPAFVASDIELQRESVSYTLDTVKVLREQLPMAKLFLLIGQDMLAVQWKGWQEITQLCTVVMAARPGGKTRRRAGSVKSLEMPQVGISSSDIRARVAAGRSIRYLVPVAVERYIRDHQLYLK